MKPSTVLGTSFIGLALALVGLNAFMPTWPALDKSGASSPITQAATPPDGADSAKTPFVAANLPSETAPPADEIRRKPAPAVRLVRNTLVRPAQHAVHVALAPRRAAQKKAPRSSGKASRNEPGLRATPVQQPRRIVRKAPPTHVRTAPPAPVLAMVPVPIARPEPVVAEPPPRRAAAVTTSSSDFTQLQRKAELDFIRRTAMGLAKRGKPGTSIVSADVDDLHHGNYRAVLVENGPHGTLVESMYFRPSRRGGSFLAARHVLSSSVSDPAADAWTPSQ